ncbi:hypothetical protein Ocin01_17750, partial [Orchesella cincta]
MDLKERLLQNEIQHLGQIIQTLSYELIVLQDFMKEEYGKKFEAFRSNYSENDGTNGPPSASTSAGHGKNHGNVRESSKSKSRSFELSSSANDEVNEVESSNTNATPKIEIAAEVGLETQSDNEMDISEVGGESDCEFSGVTSSEEEGGLPGRGKVGGGSKAKSKCWSKFKMGRDEYGKRTATCKACRLVYSSPRAHRLIEHLHKCEGVFTVKQPQRDDSYKKSKFAQEVGGPGPQSVTPGATRSRGRKMQQAWLYFNVTEGDDGKRTATCKWCGHLYSSPKVERLILHLEKCQDPNKGQTETTATSIITLKTPKQEVHRNEESTNFIDEQDDSSIESDGNEAQNDNACFSSEEEFTDDGIEIEAKNLKDPLETDSEKKGGRKKMKIWKYFDTITLRNGKVSAKCHLCQTLVSARAPRMVEHRIKCQRMSETQRTVLGRKRKLRKEMGSTIKRAKEEITDSSINETVGLEAGNVSGSAQDNPKGQKIGRHLDLIWAYFTLVENGNLKKAKCIACGQF